MSSIKSAVVEIPKSTIKKAEDVCAEHGGELEKIVSKYDHDLLCCSNGIVIRADKNKEQTKWVSYKLED
jgi:hypothetical protein